MEGFPVMSEQKFRQIVTNVEDTALVFLADRLHDAECPWLVTDGDRCDCGIEERLGEIAEGK